MTHVLNEFSNYELTTLVQLRRLTTRGWSYFNLWECEAKGYSRDEVFALQKAGFVDCVFTEHRNYFVERRLGMRV